jgi:hypothetical protein
MGHLGITNNDTAEAAAIHRDENQTSRHLTDVSDCCRHMLCGLLATTATMLSRLIMLEEKL